MNSDTKRPPKRASLRYEDSLTYMCQKVIAMNIDKFPPDVFGLLGEPTWEEVVQTTHRLTEPKEGTRQIPAIKPITLSRIELACPSLAQSTVTDELVWRDCVEFTFRSGGLTRPRALQMPFPDLVKLIQDVGRKLERGFNESSFVFLLESPMSVSLLKSTGIGRTIKQLKKQETNQQQKERLSKLLDKFKRAAAREGVDVGVEQASQDTDDDLKDLQVLEQCTSWRNLYHALKQRSEEKKSEQGKRMREIRENLSKGRPKVTKVRTASAKEQRMLGHPMDPYGTSTREPTSKNFLKVRREAITAASRTPTGPAQAQSRPKSFSAAVAFASGSTNSSGSKRKVPGVNLGNGKILHVPKKMKIRQKLGRR